MDIDNIENAEHELDEGIGRLHRLIHFYEILDYSFPSFSDALLEQIATSKTFVTQLRLILEKQDWDKIPELKKKMLLILQEIQHYQMTLRNNQEEYELLLKIQRDYQNLILELNVLHQNQEKYNLACQYSLQAENNQKRLIDNPPTYSSVPRLEPTYQPFSGKKDNEESN